MLRRHRREALVVVWSLGLSLLLLGPALLPGYVLSYDMVWVPDLAMRTDFLGVGSGLPRAVPSDAVVALLDEVVPGMLLQKVVLLGSLVAAGLGAARLTRRQPLVVVLVAVTLATWNPFVVERLGLGAWPVVVGYAAVFWVVDACRSWQGSGAPAPAARLPTRLLWLVPVACLSASAGIATAGVLLALSPGGRRRWWALLLAVAGNAPWLVSGLLHTGSATSDAAGAAVFATRSEGLLPGPLAALGLGGVWNSEVVPGSRTGVLGVVALVLVVALALVGLVGNRWATSRREAWGLVLCWSVGWLLAVLSWLAPGALGWLATHVPGAGVVRDGSRLLVLCAPLVVLAAAHGAGRVWSAVVPAAGGPRAAVVPRLMWAAALALAPVAVLPDAAGGLAGRLHAVDYPAAWAEARAVVARAHARTGGDVLVLPASSYRQPSWNRGAKVLDPLGRYLTPDYLASDVLVVGDVVLAGEDPRFADAVQALSAGRPEERASGLARLGVAVVVTDERAPGPAPEVAGTVLLDGPDLVVLGLDDVDPTRAPTRWWVAMSFAWAAFLGGPLTALLRGARRCGGRHPRC